MRYYRHTLSLWWGLDYSHAKRFLLLQGLIALTMRMVFFWVYEPVYIGTSSLQTVWRNLLSPTPGTSLKIEVASPSGTWVTSHQTARCHTVAPLRHISITMHKERKQACEFVVVQRNKERIYVREAAIQYTIYPLHLLHQYWNMSAVYATLFPLSLVSPFKISFYTSNIKWTRQTARHNSTTLHAPYTPHIIKLK